MITPNTPFSIDSHKLYLHPQKVADYLHGGERKFKVTPIYVEISPVGHCNQRCIFCALDYLGYKKRYIDTNSLLLCIRDMGKTGVKSIMFGGEGEPLLHPDLGMFVADCKESKIDCALTTNGTMLSRSFVDLYLTKFAWVKVSVNGGTAGDYARVHNTGYDVFDKVLDNIRYAVEHKQGTTVGVQCVLLPDNAGSIPALAQTCAKLGVDYLVIKPYSKHKMSLHKGYDKLRYEEYYKMLSDLEECSTSTFRVVVRTDSLQDWDKQEHKYTRCLSVPYLWAYIDSTGDVYGCSCFLDDKNWVIGNVHNNLFHDVWHGKRRRMLIDYVSNLDIKACRINCRMDKCNKYLHQLKNPPLHHNFI